MKQRKQTLNLGWGDYVSPDQTQNTETGRARWMFIRTISGVLPRFFEQLREKVYPTFARLAEDRLGYWEPGWTFETWQLQSDPDRQLTPCLVTWAREFHAEETWILEGALQTMWLWHRDPELRESFDFVGFQSACCVDTLSSEEERRFTIEHTGWDPQFQKWPTARQSIQEEFQKALDAHKQRLSSLMEGQGAVRTRRRYDAAHMKWFILYQLGGISSGKILRQSRDLKGDESTIMKGVKAVADLLQWKNLRKVRQARSGSAGT